MRRAPDTVSLSRATGPSFGEPEGVGSTRFDSNESTELIERLRDKGLADEREIERLKAVLAEQELRACLLEISRLISSSPTIDDVFEKVAAEAAKLVSFRRLAVHAVDLSSNTFTVHYAAGRPVPGLEQGHVHPLAGTPTEEAARTGHGVLLQGADLEQAAKSSACMARAWEAGLRATITVPLPARRGPFVMALMTTKASAYSMKDLGVAEQIAARIAGPIANAELYVELIRELQWQEGELTDFFDHLAVPLLWVAPDGTILRANKAELELLGYAPEEYIGHSIAEFHADERSLEDIRARLAAREALREFPARLRAKDGSIKHVLIDSNARWEGGKFVHMRCVTRDVTERVRAEATILQQARELAVLQERNRMARDIHDTIAQDFIGISLQLGAAQMEGAQGPDSVMSSIERARKLATNGLEETRRIIWYLTPQGLDGKPLDVALQEQVVGFAALGGWKPDFNVTGRPRKLNPEVQLALLRICQETLANVNKHARATAVEVDLTFVPRMVLLRLRDNGVGFDLEQARKESGQGHYGWVGMQQRARLLNGSLMVTSAPGEGTTVEVSFPTG